LHIGSVSYCLAGKRYAITGGRKDGLTLANPGEVRLLILKKAGYSID